MSAAFSKNRATAGKLYATDAVAVTPDEGEFRGREQIIEYLTQMLDAFPDAQYEPIAAYESGDVARHVTVGHRERPGVRTNEEPLVDRATGRRVRMRIVDIAIVKNGAITEHRFYFDQMDFLTQLGLPPETQG